MFVYTVRVFLPFLSHYKVTILNKNGWIGVELEVNNFHGSVEHVLTNMIGIIRLKYFNFAFVFEYDLKAWTHQLTTNKHCYGS